MNRSPALDVLPRLLALVLLALLWMYRRKVFLRI